MKPILYVTGNAVKFRTATTICKKYGLAIEQLSMDIPEIQAHEGETVARDKALRVFEEMQKPIIVSDDSWIIPGLNGFPGPYMKDVNGWLNHDDWLRLTKPLTDRRVILRQIVVYQDARQQKLFYTDVEGILLKEIRGRTIYPHTSITSLDGGKTSIAEEILQERSALAAAATHTSWDDFCEWYKANQG